MSCVMPRQRNFFFFWKKKRPSTTACPIPDRRLRFMSSTTAKGYRLEPLSGLKATIGIFIPALRKSALLSRYVQADDGACGIGNQGDGLVTRDSGFGQGIAHSQEQAIDACVSGGGGGIETD